MATMIVRIILTRLVVLRLAPDVSILNFSVMMAPVSTKVGNVMEKMIVKMAQMKKDAVSISSACFIHNN